MSDAPELNRGNPLQPKPEYVACFDSSIENLKNFNPRTFLRAQALLKEDPFTPHTARVLVDYVYTTETSFYPKHREKIIDGLRGKTIEQIRQELLDRAQQGRPGENGVAEIYKAAQELHPDFPVNHAELASLLKTAYKQAANKPSHIEESDSELRESDREAVLHLNTAAMILDSAESALKNPASLQRE